MKALFKNSNIITFCEGNFEESRVLQPHFMKKLLTKGNQYNHIL